MNTIHETHYYNPHSNDRYDNAQIIYVDNNRIMYITTRENTGDDKK